MSLECKIELDIDNQTPLDFVLKYDAKNGVTIYQKDGKTVIEHIDNWVMSCGLPPYTGNTNHGTSHYDSWLCDLLKEEFGVIEARAIEICRLALKQVYAARQIQFHASGPQAFTEK